MKNRIKEIRKALKLTQKAFAEKLDVSQSRVASWETGANPFPPSKTYQLCEVFKVSRHWLETGEGEMFEPKQVEKELDGDALKKATIQLFEKLPEEVQDAVIKTLKELYFANVSDSSLVAMNDNSKSAQVNVGGDMNGDVNITQ